MKKIRVFPNDTFITLERRVQKICKPSSAPYYVCLQFSRTVEAQMQHKYVFLEDRKDEDESFVFVKRSIIIGGNEYIRATVSKHDINTKLSEIFLESAPISDLQWAILTSSSLLDFPFEGVTKYCL